MLAFVVTCGDKVRLAEGRTALSACKKAFRAPRGWHWEEGSRPSVMGNATVILAKTQPLFVVGRRGLVRARLAVCCRLVDNG